MYFVAMYLFPFATSTRYINVAFLNERIQQTLEDYKRQNSSYRIKQFAR